MSFLPLHFDDYMFPPISRKSGNFITCSPLYGSDFYKGLYSELSRLTETDKTSVIRKDLFEASIDVQHFKPQEISVKLCGTQTLIIEGKHEEKQDEHGYIFRHFTRKYFLPEDCDLNQIRAKLSPDGVLNIAAPKKTLENQATYVNIPVIRVDELGERRADGDDGNVVQCTFPK